MTKPQLSLLDVTRALAERARSANFNFGEDTAVIAVQHLLWQVVQRSLAQGRIRRILILDDGGKCATSMPRELLTRYAVAGVEQTSFGMFVFEHSPPPFAVVSWARSAIKLQIGGPLFSQCLLANLQSRVLEGRLLPRSEEHT